MSGEQTRTVSDAARLAARAHAGARDKAGKPYFGHVERVAQRVAAADGSEDAQIAAYLHDIVEDTEWTLGDLKREGYSADVVRLVEAVTHRDGESYDAFIARTSGDPDAALIKLADLADNLDPTRLPRPAGRDEARRRKYLEAWRQLTGEDYPVGAPFQLPAPGAVRIHRGPADRGRRPDTSDRSGGEETVPTRQSGLEWLRKKGRATDERVVVSKYYTAEESRTRSPVWWFEFPTRHVTEDRFGFLNLLCRVAPSGSEYHHLRVPMGLFLACKHHLGHLDEGDKFSLYLSAEESRLFREIRGHGQIEFGVFKVD